MCLVNMYSKCQPIINYERFLIEVPYLYYSPISDAWTDASSACATSRCKGHKSCSPRKARNAR